MNHLQVYQFEKYVPKEERDWLSWAGTAEKVLGHSLDGDNAINGYSLDYAYDYFKLGATPYEYVREVKAKSNYKPVTV